MQVQQHSRECVDILDKKQTGVSVELLEKHISLDKNPSDVSVGLLDKQYRGTRTGPQLNKNSGERLEDANNSNNEEVVPEDDHGDQNSGNNEADLSTESDEELIVVPNETNIQKCINDAPQWMELDKGLPILTHKDSSQGCVGSTHSSSGHSTDSNNSSGTGDGDSESSGDISCIESGESDDSSCDDSSSSDEPEDCEDAQVSASDFANGGTAASPETGHPDGSKGSDEPSNPQPTDQQQSEHEGDTSSDDQDRYESINDGSKQPSTPSAGVETTGDSSCVPANIEQLAAERSPTKPDRFPLVNSDALPSDSDNECAGAVHQCMSSDQAAVCSPSTLFSSGRPTCVGGAQNAPPPAPVLLLMTPYNYSLVTLDEWAISGQSTVTPCMEVFGWYQELNKVSDDVLQYVTQQSYHDVAGVTVVTKGGVFFRSAREFDLGFVHYYCRAEMPEIPEFSTRASEVLVLTASDLEALVRRGIRVRGLLVVLWELGSLPPERLPRQLIARILTRVYKFAAVVLRAGGRLSVQLMDDLQIRVDTCTVLIQAAALPLIPPGHTPASDGPVCSSTAVHCSSCSRVSEVSVHHFIEMLLKESGLYEDVELRTEVFRTLFPTRLTVCAATKH